MRFRRPAKPVAWCLVLAVFLHVLWMPLAHAMQANSGAAWQEICSVDGPRFIDADLSAKQAGKQSPAESPMAHFAADHHCPICSTGFVLPDPASQQALFLSSVRDAYARALPAPPHTRSPLDRGPAPRAPPALS